MRSGIRMPRAVYGAVAPGDAGAPRARFASHSLVELGLLFGFFCSIIVVISPLVAHTRYLFLAGLVAAAMFHWRQLARLLAWWTPILLLPCWMAISCLWTRDL